MDVEKAIGYQNQAAIRSSSLCREYGFKFGPLVNRRGKSLQTQGCGGGFKWFAINVEIRCAGLNNKATRRTCGAISLSSSSHLPPMLGSMMVKPVALLPGNAKLLTKPLPTGSVTTTKTIGTVRVR
jgi:hypothetical protein